MRSKKRILAFVIMICMFFGQYHGVFYANDIQDISTMSSDITISNSTTSDTTAPDSTTLGEASSNTSVPDSTTPSETVPDTTTPDSTTPGETVPDTTAPDSTMPDETVPDTTAPDSTTPGETVPDTTTPDSTTPDTAPPQPTDTIKEVIEWSFNASETALEDNYLRVLKSGTQLDITDLKSMLPQSIHATIVSEEDESELDIPIVGWECDTYIQDENGLWPETGEHIFTAVIEDGYLLTEIPTVIAVPELSGLMPPLNVGLTMLQSVERGITKEGIAGLIYMSYFPGGPEVYEFSPFNTGVTGARMRYDFNLYSDFDWTDTYMPTSVWSVDSEDPDRTYQKKVGSFTGHDYWYWWINAYRSQNIGGMFEFVPNGPYPPVVSDIFDSYIKLNHKSPDSSVTLSGFEGYYDKSSAVEEITRYLSLKVGINENNLIDVDGLSGANSTEQLQNIVNNMFDRVFVKVTDNDGEWPYQMKMEGNWVPDPDSPSKFPGSNEKGIKPGIYRFIPSDELKEKWVGKTGDKFFWRDIQVDVQVGYLIKEYYLDQKLNIAVKNGDGVAVKNILEKHLPESALIRLLVGLYGGMGKESIKHLPLKWELDPDYYGENLSSVLEGIAKIGDTLYFVPALEDGYIELESAKRPRMAVEIVQYNYDPSDTSESEVNTVIIENKKYITKYHVESMPDLEEKYDYLKKSGYGNISSQFNYVAFPNQTLESLGWSSKVVVDYYTDGGLTGQETLDLDWEMVNNNPSDPNGPIYYGFDWEGNLFSVGKIQTKLGHYTYIQGFNEKRGETEAVLKGQAPNLGEEWQHAPGVEPLELHILVLRDWINIDIGVYARDLSMTVENGILTVNHSYLPHQYFINIKAETGQYTYYEDMYSPSSKVVSYDIKDTYNMKDYTGIRLYTNDDSGFLYSMGLLDRTLLTVKDENVNLILDNVSMKQVSYKKKGLPLIDIVSTKYTTSQTKPYRPHRAEKYWSDAEDYFEFWYPKVNANEFTSSLNIYVTGKNSLEADAMCGEVIRVPYNAMLSISGLNNADTELTLIGPMNHVVIGDDEECGHIFINDIPLKLGKNIDLANTISFMGANTNSDSNIAKQLLNGQEGYDTQGNLRKREFNVKSRPIVITGPKAKVVPILQSKIGNSVKWSEKMTVGSLDLSLDSRLILEDGATLCTATSYLPPAYSIQNAWEKREEHPFKNSKIIFNYGSKDENTVQFDSEGMITVNADVDMKENSRGKTDFNIGVNIKIKGMYPLTPLDFMVSENKGGFGPVKLQEIVDGNENNENIVNTMIPYKTTGNVWNPIEMAPLEGTVDMNFARNKKNGVYEFKLSADSDLYSMEPVTYTFTEEEKPTILNYRLITDKEMLSMMTDYLDGDYQIKDDATIVQNMLKEAYGVTTEDLNNSKINPETPWITEEERRELTILGTQRIMAESQAEDAKRKAEEQKALYEEQNMLPEQKAEKKAKEMADKYGITVAELEALGVDIGDPNVVTILSDEQRRQIQGQTKVLMEKREENVLNNYSYSTTLGPYGASYYIQFVDRLAPGYGDLVNNYFPQFIFAEVMHTIDGEDMITFEFIPVESWKEEFLSSELKSLTPWQRGFVSGDSYATKPNLSFVKANDGFYMFSGVLPEKYTFNTGIASVPSVSVNVLESEKTKESNYKIGQLLDQLMGKEQVSTNSYLVDDSKLEITLELEEELQNYRDDYITYYYPYLILFDRDPDDDFNYTEETYEEYLERKVREREYDEFHRDYRYWEHYTTALGVVTLALSLPRLAEGAIRGNFYDDGTPWVSKAEDVLMQNIYSGTTTLWMCFFGYY